MTKPAPYLSVCIPTYNRSRYLEKCLMSVVEEIQNAGLEHDVIIQVSDNNSTDGTASVVQKIINTSSVTIYYSKNGENIGAVNNFILLTETSRALYTFILGDDDEVVKGSFSSLLQMIKDNPDILVHHYKCVQTDFIPLNMPLQKLNAFAAAEKYFYNLGNAGTFIFNTARAQQVIQKAKERIAGTCWPQTEIMFLMLMQESGRDIFLASSIELVSSESHGENVVYNSWYIVETFCFSLLRIAQNVSEANANTGFSTSAKKAIPACREKVKFFFRFLLFITYYDYGYEVEKTKQLIKENKQYLKGFDSFYPAAYCFLLSLPGWCRKVLVGFYFLISNRSLKKSKFDKSYAEVKAYQRRKFEIYKQKGKLTEDKERYIY